MSGSTATASPPTPLLDQRRFRDLFEARSVVGAIVIVAVLSLFGFGLQALDDVVRNASRFAVGQPEQVTPTVFFTPSDGWLNDIDQTVPGTAVVATKNGWEIKVAAPFALQAGQSLEDFAKVFHDIPAGDPSTVRTDIVTFTTTSGLRGVTWTDHGATTAATTWLIANESGSTVAQFIAEGPASGSTNLESEVLAMAKSLTIAEPAGGATE